MKFLVVDDSRFARELLRRYIESLGFEVIAEAQDGLDAIQKFKENLPTIVTIDLEMPHMKGIEAAKEILKLDPKCHIILVTSIIDKKETINALRVGIKKVLTKPFTQQEFENALHFN